MLYLNEAHIKQVGINWRDLIAVIEEAVKCMAKQDFVQPLKPYLRYRDLANRIIAMPGFLGGGFNVAGIKWISSFPKNIEKNIPRAHSLVILNEPDNGIPQAVINTALLSIIRTASVSGLVASYFLKARKISQFNLGIVGWGPIGKHHYQMCQALYGPAILSTHIYDIKGMDSLQSDRPETGQLKAASSWEEVYDQADIFIACTTSRQPYIDRPPKRNSLLLNVSLRDFSTEVYPYVKEGVFVDDWDEVCRENTDIENLAKAKGLTQADTKSIMDIVTDHSLEKLSENVPVFFNPMGMAVFDLAVASHYYQQALQKNIGVNLP
jgi:2,3-diaminopropionate biosynthesis protein SbnB